MIAEALVFTMFFLVLILCHGLPRSRKFVSRSNAKPEYWAPANAVAEIMWTGYVLREFYVPIFQTFVIYCNNTSWDKMAMHARTKHVEVDYHFVKDRDVSETFILHCIPSEDQLTDAMTKTFSSTRLSVLFEPSKQFYLNQ